MRHTHTRTRPAASCCGARLCGLACSRLFVLCGGSAGCAEAGHPFCMGLAAAGHSFCAGAAAAGAAAAAAAAIATRGTKLLTQSVGTRATVPRTAAIQPNPYSRSYTSLFNVSLHAVNHAVEMAAHANARLLMMNEGHLSAKQWTSKRRQKLSASFTPARSTANAFRANLRSGKASCETWGSN